MLAQDALREKELKQVVFSIKGGDPSTHAQMQCPCGLVWGIYSTEGLKSADLSSQLFKPSRRM